MINSSALNLERLYKSTTIPDAPQVNTSLGDGERSGGRSFTQAVSEMGEATINTLTTAEQTALNGMAGKADPHAVVEALAATEMALETAVSVRDKAVEAYQEILRMPV